jgi:hypothetical protein
MGNEIQCKVKFGGKEGSGKALLETSELIFRGEFKLKIPFASIKSVVAKDGVLSLKTADGVAAFRVGTAAEKWREKILHPKSRIEKLGVKAGAKIALLGEFEADFLKEIGKLNKAVNNGKVAADSDAIFFAAETKAHLAALSKISKAMQGAAALWIVYPKGQTIITEIDVISSGRKAGLKDVKVVGFSATHTALKCVIPLANR